MFQDQPATSSMLLGNHSVHFDPVDSNFSSIDFTPELKGIRSSFKFKHHALNRNEFEVKDITLIEGDQLQYFAFFIEHRTSDGMPVVGMRARRKIPRGTSFFYHGAYLSTSVLNQWERTIGPLWTKTCVSIGDIADQYANYQAGRGSLEAVCASVGMGMSITFWRLHIVT